MHETLDRLIERELVARLERRPGHKEERYIQLLQDSEAGGGSSPDSEQAYAPAAPTPSSLRRPSRELEDLRERVERLEQEVAELRAAMRNPVYEHQP